MEIISLLAAVVSIFLAIISILGMLNSIRKSKKNISKYEKILKDKYVDNVVKKTTQKYIEEHLSGNISDELINLEKFSKNIKVNEKDFIVTYSKYLRTARTLQTLGRTNRLSERNSRYRKIWFFLNSGLVDSVVKNIVYNEETTEIDKNTIIGMLVGEKIKKDTKSYIYIFLSFLIAILLPLTGVIEISYWLLAFLLFMFSMLALNQKVLEYRISNGLYGGNEYEAREIISYIENHSNPDDFYNGGERKVFQKSKGHDEVFNGLYGELLN
ncbi:hypothetical protein WKI44_08840 [Vibrio alginolyticus]|uniref:hypothetical protein n=1 Tax=Vibrio alginolyticus TaxID=663 RepID=UPI00215D0901|nr:hypothetical protein [Vibrio alginolyticus]MCR9415162.1 hypothetical protein [Vibrio alginolyticus]